MKKVTEKELDMQKETAMQQQATTQQNSSPLRVEQEKKQQQVTPAVKQQQQKTPTIDIPVRKEMETEAPPPILKHNTRYRGTKHVCINTATHVQPDQIALSSQDIEAITKYPTFLHKATKSVNPDTRELHEYSKLQRSSEGEKWETGMQKDMGRLAQGDNVTGTAGTKTIRFIE